VALSSAVEYAYEGRIVHSSFRLKMNSYRMIVVIIGAVIYFCNAESNDTLDELDIEERDEFLGKNLNKLPTGMPGWARRFTMSKTGCPCWWDLTLGTVCACCKNFRRLQGQPCGYPLHNYCQRKRNAGCPGLLPNGNRKIPAMDYERYTLSTRGYPCHYDKSDNSCAWCLPGSQQCGKARTWANRYLDKNRRMKNKWKKENTCLPVVNTDRKSYAKRPWVVCIGQVQDCNRQGNECDENAECVDTGVKKTDCERKSLEGSSLCL
jgi:hypothetical protein